MQCPVCAALNREHNHECEAEASATLKGRALCDPPTRQRLESEVLCSRKRQAHLASELHQHRMAQHPTPSMARAAAG